MLLTSTVGHLSVISLELILRLFFFTYCRNTMQLSRLVLGIGMWYEYVILSFGEINRKLIPVK